MVKALFDWTAIANQILAGLVLYVFLEIYQNVKEADPPPPPQLTVKRLETGHQSEALFPSATREAAERAAQRAEIAETMVAALAKALVDRNAALESARKQSTNRYRPVESDVVQPSSIPAENSQNRGSCTVRFTNPEARLLKDYFGDCNGGLANGYGTVEFYIPKRSLIANDTALSGEFRYSGMFMQGAPSGQGILESSSNSLRYEGTFDEWQLVDGEARVVVQGYAYNAEYGSDIGRAEN